MWWVPIACATIGGPLMWGLHKFDQRNSAQHNQSLGLLGRIETKLEKLDDRVHAHIHWHAHIEKKDKEKHEVL
jgi:hypothetical protein